MSYPLTTLAIIKKNKPRSFKLIEIKQGIKREGVGGKGKGGWGMDDIPSQNGSKGDKNKTSRAEVRGPDALGECAAGQGPMWRTAWSTAWPSGRAPPCWSCTVWRCYPPAGQLERKQSQRSVNTSSLASSKPGKRGVSGKLALAQGVGREARCCALEQGHLRHDLQVTCPGDRISPPPPEEHLPVL